MYCKMILLVSVVLLSSCKEVVFDDSGDTSYKRFVIDSYQQPCVGVGQKFCLRARGIDENDFSNFHGGIRGFDFTWGYRYEVDVLDIKIDNPPADSSDVEMILIELVSKQEDSIGTEYTMLSVQLLENTLSSQNGAYQLLGKGFSCAADVDCEALLAIKNTETLVNLRFQYIGGSEIELVSWEL